MNAMSLATITVDEAAGRSWDVLIVGAGPAGTVAATCIAQRGMRVLLVDKTRFPRPKVCGGCLNQVAMSVLESIGAGDLMNTLGAGRISQMMLASHGRIARLGLLPGYAISRIAFDAALVARAIAAGTHFVDRSAVHMCEDGPVLADRVVDTRVTIISDGLKGTALDGDCAPVIQPGARIGVGTTLDAPPSVCPPGVIQMACAKDGYVGMVRVEDGRLNLAAAIESEAIARHGGIATTLSNIVEQSGLTVPPLPEQHRAYHGVGGLTRRRSYWWGRRMLLIGDATSYVEPFTGEGMAWAMAGGLSVTPFVQAAVTEGWRDDIGRRWQSHWRRQLSPRQRLCRSLAWGLRRPILTRWAVGGLQHWSGGARWVAGLINQPMCLKEAVV